MELQSDEQYKPYEENEEKLLTETSNKEFIRLYKLIYSKIQSEKNKKNN